MFYQHLQSKLDSSTKDGSFRKLTLPNQNIDFYSNDYLGLAHNKELIAKTYEICKSNDHLLGSTGSRLISGNSVYFEKVENQLANIFQSETTLLFNSGYVANIGVFSCLPSRGDTILYDELSHASIKEGIRLSQADKFSFRHNDLAELEKKT